MFVVVLFFLHIARNNELQNNVGLSQSQITSALCWRVKESMGSLILEQNHLLQYMLYILLEICYSLCMLHIVHCIYFQVMEDVAGSLPISKWNSVNLQSPIYKSAYFVSMPYSTRYHLKQTNYCQQLGHWLYKRGWSKLSMKEHVT